MERSIADRRSMPGGVLAAEIVLYLSAALNLLVGVVLLVVGAVGEAGPDQDLATIEIVIGVVMIVWGVAMLLLARAIARGSHTARNVWVILNGIQILGATASLIQGHIGAGIISIAVPSLLIYLVFTPQAEQFFREGASRSAQAAAPGP